MTPPGGKKGVEFLKIPKAVRETRRISWLAKALVCHLRFRQRGRETVTIGMRRLATDLGASMNAVSRAVGEAEARGWLRVLNRHTRERGERFVYDARPVDDAESVAESGTLSEAKRLRNEGTSVAKSKTPMCTTSGDTTVSEPGARQENVKKTSPRRERDPEQRLLSFAFPGGPTEKQKAALLKPIGDASAAGVPYPWLARALVSGKVDGPPWKRIDDAIGKAKAIVVEISRHSPKRFQDLQHVTKYVADGGDGLPEKIEVNGVRYDVAQIVEYATKWPG